MRLALIVPIMLLATGLNAADDKGFCFSAPTRPPSAAKKAPTQPTPPDPDAQFVGTVTLMAAISDKGYVSDAKVIRGLDKETDNRAADSIRQGHFQPARRKGGQAVAVVVSVDVNYWRKGGELIQVPPNFAQAQPDSTHPQ